MDTRDGRTVGLVRDVEGTLTGSRLVVDGADGEVLIPLVAPICTEVDPAAKRIVIDPPEGLIEVNAPAAGRVDAMTFDIVTIFPAMIEQPLAAGIIGRAIERGTLDVKVRDLRDFTTDRHRVVDDVPYGGGPGMVLKPDPIFRALDAIAAERGDAADGDPDVAAGARASRRPRRSG